MDRRNFLKLAAKAPVLVAGAPLILPEATEILAPSEILPFREPVRVKEDIGDQHWKFVEWWDGRELEDRKGRWAEWQINQVGYAMSRLKFNPEHTYQFAVYFNQVFR